jgi:acetylornithine deacetylase/succinyl-diaminopimelate desuccinylase-like protein
MTPRHPVMSDVLTIARDLIRIDTTNDVDATTTGNETLAAEYLAGYLADAGLECHLVAREPHRANLVARLPGAGGGPSLAFVGHTDVVPAEAAGWTHPPFEAFVDEDGYLHGRGALDMKGELAARAVAVAELARAGFRPSGDLWFLAVADEEDGTADVGMRWLLEQRPEIRPAFALNEGGGEVWSLPNGRRLIGVSVGEKGTLPARVTAVGEAGHASRPDAGDNPVPALAQLLVRLGLGSPRVRATPWLLKALEAVFGSAPADIDTSTHSAELLNPRLGSALRPMGGTTMTPTMLSASRTRNVIPAEASVELDCRLVPGTTVADVETEIRERLGDDVPYTISWPESLVPGSASNETSELMAAIDDFLRAHASRLTSVPILDAGFTDSVHLRAAAGTTAYGFNPYLHTPPDVLTTGFHNVDERVHVRDLALSVEFHIFIARQLLREGR